jgi:PTS system fructose-specific IIA component/PTS system nitrogen regulatory IIA component
VIAELVGSLVTAGAIQASDQEGIVSAILKREELGSTGIGHGVAVPHTKHPCVERLYATVGVSVGGVDFDSLDGEKVQLFFLLVSPPDQRAEHLKALEYISKHLHNETFRRFLKQSRTSDEIRQVLEEFDQ